jgi:hypothetical protein
MKRRLWLGLAVLLGVLGLAGAGQGGRREPDWEAVLARRLVAFGHRNWIVIADSAYPVQSRPGIETVVVDANHLEVVQALLDMLGKAKHVRPVIYLDAELPHVEDSDAPGISRFRSQLKRMLGRRAVLALPHEKIIDRLDKAGERFQVLVLKTNLTLPYTSVFVELDCGYWSDEAEGRLRKAMGKAAKKP